MSRWRMASHPYTKGLHEVGDGVFAYLQPDGGWGWSNAGLVVDGESSLLVDTLFDLKLTAEMLDAMRSATPAAQRHRHRGQHPCQRRPLLGQPARARRRDRRLPAVRRGAARAAALRPGPAWSTRAPEGPMGDMLRHDVRRVRLPRHRAGAAPPPPSTASDPAGGRHRGAADRGRPRAHPGRRRRPPARPGGRLHRRHPLPRRAPHRVGGTGVELGGRL